MRVRVWGVRVRVWDESEGMGCEGEGNNMHHNVLESHQLVTLRGNALIINN